MDRKKRGRNNAFQKRRAGVVVSVKKLFKFSEVLGSLGGRSAFLNSVLACSELKI